MCTPESSSSTATILTVSISNLVIKLYHLVLYIFKYGNEIIPFSITCIYNYTRHISVLCMQFTMES